VTGIQLAEGLKPPPHPPAIVFVTAFSHFAVKAFELNALDYLVKPVDQKRLLATICKVSEHIGAELPPMTGAETDEEQRVMVTKLGKKLFIMVRDIVYIMAKDDYSYLFTADDRFLSTSSLTRLESELEPSGIFRVHRRYLVNLARIQSLTLQSGGTLLLVLDGAEDEIPVSRRRVPALKQILGLT
ncbi:MAG: LytTR family DNA-binding domain-containing protein, partial [Actinomycetes bacterium]|jgi:two-component system response regulator LytT|nr:LytTR family DNA-binding domain-containing protein [Actinomycetes bacterium]